MCLLIKYQQFREAVFCFCVLINKITAFFFFCNIFLLSRNVKCKTCFASTPKCTQPRTGAALVGGSRFLGIFSKFRQNVPYIKSLYVREFFPYIWGRCQLSAIMPLNPHLAYIKRKKTSQGCFAHAKHARP